MSAREKAPGETLHQVNLGLSALAERVAPSLVQVRGRGRGGGAGVVLHERGLIVTSAHVLRGRRAQVETIDGRTLEARMLGADRGTDLAALSVEDDELIPLPFGDSERLRPGAWVLAFGHPWGVAGAATAGVVIGQGADLAEAPGGRDWLALSLHLRPGNSGGPVVDDRGRLLGLNTMMAGPDVGLAVPAHVVKPFLRRAVEKAGRSPRRQRRPAHGRHWL